VSALWQGLPTLPPGRPKVSEPNVRPETFGQVTAGSGDPRRAREAKSGKLFPSCSYGGDWERGRAHPTPVVLTNKTVQ
jgi:hypothetical protein